MKRKWFSKIKELGLYLKKEYADYVDRFMCIDKWQLLGLGGFLFIIESLNPYFLINFICALGIFFLVFTLFLIVYFFQK